MTTLNSTQLEILKLFQYEKSEEELLEIKKLISDYLFRKAILLADQVHEEKQYSQEDIEKWKDEHTRLNKKVQ